MSFCCIGDRVIMLLLYRLMGILLQKMSGKKT